MEGHRLQTHRYKQWHIAESFNFANTQCVKRALRPSTDSMISPPSDVSRRWFIRHKMAGRLGLPTRSPPGVRERVTLNRSYCERPRARWTCPTHGSSRRLEAEVASLSSACVGSPRVHRCLPFFVSLSLSPSPQRDGLAQGFAFLHAGEMYARFAR